MVLRKLSAAAVGFSALVGLSACAPVVVVEPQPHATDPACADVMLRLPEVIGNHEKRKASSQATAAWGDPSAVVLRCGGEMPGPSTDHCVRADDVDWVSREGEGDTWIFETYGRSPSVELTLDTTKIAGAEALSALSAAVQQIEAQRECVGAEDVNGEAPEDEAPSEAPGDGN